jgi:hypothetical protein
MRHFHRTHIPADRVLAIADEFFPTLPLRATATEARGRTYAGELGTVTIRVSMEGGHYTRIEAATDQMGESRLDRNVKRFFVKVHRDAEPRHALEAAY